MPKKIFISYSHRQGDWVRGRLAPCLKAGGAEVLIDRERFEAGKAPVRPRRSCLARATPASPLR